MRRALISADCPIPRNATQPANGPTGNAEFVDIQLRTVGSGFVDEQHSGVNRGVRWSGLVRAASNSRISRCAS
jgi:hypothetical protein